MGRKIILAFQTLGVVFGDVGTSPLYTFDVMFSKAPINDNEDILGALSLVLYALILIPLVKYVFVVLWANDDGEGMLDVVTYTFLLNFIFIYLFNSDRLHSCVCVCENPTLTLCRWYFCIVLVDLSSC